MQRDLVPQSTEIAGTGTMETDKSFSQFDIDKRLSIKQKFDNQFGKKLLPVVCIRYSKT